jgi:hypothetical protein
MKLNLSTPWQTFFSELEALFGKDPDITLDFNNDNNIILYVDGEQKASALSQLLPAEKVFGNVRINIVVVPSNTLGKSTEELFRVAFKDNPVLSYVASENKGMFAMDYVVFKHEVVQFFNDDLSDINGNCTTLYEDIARDVFEDVQIQFCTDAEGNPGEPTVK